MKITDKEVTTNALGIDIGGSHITVSAIDRSARSLIPGSLVRMPVDSLSGADEILDLWASAIRECIERTPARLEHIGIAMPGPMDYQNGVCLISNQQKYHALYGMNLGEMLAERLSLDPRTISFKNDAACYLQGEVYCGSLRGFKRAIGVTLGTGLGTSHTFRGRAMDSALWNMPFQNGIAEDYLATRWFVKRFEEMSGQRIRDVKDFVDRFEGTPDFLLLFSEFSLNLALFIHKFIRKKIPQAVVIGGNIANAHAHFMGQTSGYLTEMLGYGIPVKKSALGETAALIGAGAFEALNERVNAY